MNALRTPFLLTIAFACTLACGASSPAQDRIAILEGPSSSNLTLRVLDESQPTGSGTVFLTGLQVLPLEITNRTTQTTFDAGRTRRIERQGLVQVELPQGGRILKYRRGSAHFGFLLILPDGRPAILHESAGTGSGNTVDPYSDRIAVAPDGQHACLALRAGPVYAIRLDGGNYASTKSPARRLTLPTGVMVSPLGVSVGATHVFLAGDDDKVRRCGLADGNQPQDLTPTGPTGARLKDEFAPSGDGKSVAFLFGPKDQYSIYLLGSSGATRRLPPKAAKYEEPGYLPEVSGGPRLLLNHDATRLMYVDATSRDEIFLLDTSGSLGTTHVTSDANFQPYIGIGIIPAFAAQSLIVAIGNPNAHDWYVATTNSRTVTNLTFTGPRSTPPFDAGKLDPTSGFLAPDGSMITVEKVGTNDVRVRRVDPRSGRTGFLTESLRAAPMPSAGLGGLPTVLFPGRTRDALIQMSGTLPMLFAPPGVRVSPEVIATSGFFSLLQVRDAAAPTGPALALVHLYGLGFLPLTLDTKLRQEVLTRAGGALLNGSTLRYLAPGVDKTIPGTPAVRIVVSGAFN